MSIRRDPRAIWRSPPTSSASSAERLHQDPARALERRADIGDALVGVDIARPPRVPGRSVGIVQQRERQRLEPGFARDLRLRAPLRLVGQIEVFEPRLGVGGANRRRELRRQLALLLDALQDDVAPLLELAQVGQPLFERAERVSSSPPVASLR